MEASYKDPSTLRTIEAKNWPKTFGAFNEYFQGLRGCKVHPLSYVFRMNLIPTAHAVNPVTGIGGSVYLTLNDKLLVRGPFIAIGAAVCPYAEMIGPFVDAFLVDRARVWEKPTEILLTSNLFTVIKNCEGKSKR
jgi:hypothetical protein